MTKIKQYTEFQTYFYILNMAPVCIYCNKPNFNKVFASNFQVFTLMTAGSVTIVSFLTSLT